MKKQEQEYMVAQNPSFNEENQELPYTIISGFLNKKTNIFTHDGKEAPNEGEIFKDRKQAERWLVAKITKEYVPGVKAKNKILERKLAIIKEAFKMAIKELALHCFTPPDEDSFINKAEERINERICQDM